MSDPWVSFVVATRNDDYGRNLVDRTSLFIRNLAWQSQKFGLHAELVLVEWNPPSDRPRLREVLHWPKSLAPLVVRIIEVPSEFHNRLPNSDRMPIFDHRAKNVGIRRARGQFVLSTNPDLLFNSALIEWTATGIASEKAFYRIDRIDFRGPLPESEDPNILLKSAKQRAFMVHVRHFRNMDPGIRLKGLRGWAARHLDRWPNSSSFASECRRINRWETVLGKANSPMDGLHTNAAGDFMMASREAWHAINGVYETTDAFYHIDTYATHQLYASGLEQRVLSPPCLLFHMDHDRSTHATRPQFENDRVAADLHKIRSGLMGPRLNDENWGLPEATFPEVSL